MTKIGIIGTGYVGSSYAYSLVTQNLVDELVLIDINKEIALANAQDIYHGTDLLKAQPKIYVGEYRDLSDCSIICIACGVATKANQSRLDVAGDNKTIVLDVMENIKNSGFDGIILVATNPVDIITYLIIKEANWPKEHVIGSGTVLDTSRFRGNLCSYLNYNPSQIHANIIGEHGDSSVAVLSNARIANQPLIDVINNSNGEYTIDGVIDCYKRAQNSAYSIIKGKGATYYGIGTALAHITKSIIRNENLVLTVSTYINNEYEGIDNVCLSLPCVVNKNGIREIFKSKLSTEELLQLQISANKLKTVINNIK